MGRRMTNPADKAQENQRLEMACRMMIPVGRALNAACIYGAGHSRMRQVIEETYAEFHPLISIAQQLNVNVVEGRIRLDNVAPQVLTPFLRMLRTRMESISLDGFCITQDVTLSEFASLFSALASPKPNEFRQQLEAGTLRGITVSKYRYRAITDAQRVVDAAGGADVVGGGSSKRAGLGGGCGQGVAGPHVLNLDQAETASPAPEPGRMTPEEAGFSARQYQQIIAFIKGGVSERPGAGVTSGLTQAATDPERLASLIMEATILRKNESLSVPGESLADIVVGCLRRTVDHLRPTLLSQSGGGPISAQKSLLVLEKLVLDKMRSLMGAPSPGAEDKIHAVLREMEGRLEADAVAFQFMEHHAALTEQERKIIHLLHTHGPDFFNGTVLEGGLPTEKWQQLLFQSGAAGGGSGGPGGDGMPMPTAISTLANVLEQFEALMKIEPPPQVEMRALLKRIGKSVDDVSADADTRMEQLREHLYEVQGRDVSEQEIKTLMGRLSELAQELLQPLTVVNCVINLLLGGQLGLMNEASREMLSLAGGSSGRLRDLIDRLVSIVGLPAGLSPDFKLVYGDQGKPKETHIP